MNDTRNSNHKATASGATAAREAVLRGEDRPAPNLGSGFGPDELGKIPEELRNQSRWLSWCWIEKDDPDGRYWTKLPMRATAGKFTAGYSFHDGNHEACLLPLDGLAKKMAKSDPDASTLGLMFSPHTDAEGRTWVALDFDGFTFDKPEDLPDVLGAAFVAGAGYWCNSPSGHGLRIVGYVTDGKPCRGGKTVEGIEVELKATGCPTITTASRVETSTLNITTFWRVYESRLKAKTERRRFESAGTDPFDNDAEWMAHLTHAAEKYLETMDEAVAGSSGHNSFFRVCCRVAGGFGLRGDEGFDLVSQFNEMKCSPPFTEGEVLHKWDGALDATEGEEPVLRQKPLATFKKLQAAKAKRATKKFTGYTHTEAPGEPAGKATPEAGTDGTENATADDAGSEPQGCPFTGPAGAQGQAENSDDSTATTGGDSSSDGKDGPKERVAAGEAEDGEQVHAKRARDGRWIIVQDDDRHDRMLSQLARHLANQPEQRVFQRNGAAHVVLEVDVPIRYRHPETGDVVVRGTTRKGICRAERGHLMPLVSRAVAFRKVKLNKETGEKKLLAVPVPGSLLNSLQASPDGLPPLRGLLFGPVYDQDNDTVLNGTGYHTQIGMVQVGEVAGLRVPDRVTLQDARAAAERVLHPFRFFPWPKGRPGEGCIHRGRLLMAMLTAVQRWSFFQCPLFILRGQSAGTGKTIVASALSEIAHGAAPRLMPWVRGQHAGEELRKRLIALLDAGEQFAIFDNLPVGSTVDEETLCALATSPRLLDRMMGKNDGAAQVGGENRLMLVLTGNNIRPANDSAERFLCVDFDAPEVNRRTLPLSAFGDVGELVAYIRAHRAEILADLLLILRGYQQAGRPQVNCTEWGSFADWMDRCARPAAWALQYDPLAGLHTEWTDGSTEGAGLGQLAGHWVRHYRGRAFTARDLLTIATPPGLNDDRKFGLAYDADFADALSAACETDDLARFGSRHIGRKLGAFAGTPANRGKPRVAGRRIDLGEAGAWCLMQRKDPGLNQSGFTIEPFAQPDQDGPKDEGGGSGGPKNDGGGGETLQESKVRNTGTPEQNRSGKILNGGYTTDNGIDDGVNGVAYTPFKNMAQEFCSGSSGVPEPAEPPPSPNSQSASRGFSAPELADQLDYMTAAPISRADLTAAWRATNLPFLWLVQNLPALCIETPDGWVSKAVNAARKGEARA